MKRWNKTDMTKQKRNQVKGMGKKWKEKDKKKNIKKQSVDGKKKRRKGRQGGRGE